MFAQVVQTFRMFKPPAAIALMPLGFPARLHHQQYHKSFQYRYLFRPIIAHYNVERLLSFCKPLATQEKRPNASVPPPSPNQSLGVPPKANQPNPGSPPSATQSPSTSSAANPVATQGTPATNEMQKPPDNATSSQIATAPKNKIAKMSDFPIALNKKMGWFLSGTATAVLTALYGKIFLLFGAIPLILYHSKDLDVMTKTFNRDTKFLWRHSKAWILHKRIKNDNLTLPKIFQQTEKRHPDKIMLQMHDQSWKYKDILSYANRTSRLMQKYGFQKGDVMAIMALNSPEMVAIMVGMANIGIITALISTELRNEGLTKAIKNSGCKGIIFDDALIHAFGDVYQNFTGAKIFQMRHKAIKPEFHVLEEELLKEYNDQPEVFINVHHDDPLMYLYSPDDYVFREPIVITHAKFLFDSMGTSMMLDLKPWEQIYSSTPMHETSGMVLGIGPSITNGVTTILRPKFSATEYFRECYVHHCTVGQYSGSMCKQLLLSPVSPIETFHPVRAMYGTGLESDYWQEFVDRFGTKMYEVHDTSQDFTNLMNMEGKVGVLGFRPKLLPSFMFPHYVIKVFGKDNIPVRDPNGLCQTCDYGEPGMLVKLWTSSDPLPPKVKTIQNVFKHGDMGITTGEILTLDEHLYLRPQRKHMDKSWMKRLVTSEEVEYIATKLSSKRCAAYSIENVENQTVEVLSIEDPHRKIDMQKFTEDLVDHLPINWVPHYVRLVSKFTLLPNKKVDKECLIKQGLNMEGDLVYYFNKNTLSYQPFVWGKNNHPNILNKEQPPVAQTIKPKIIPSPVQTPKASPTVQTVQANIQPTPIKTEPVRKSDPYLEFEITVEKQTAASKISTTTSGNLKEANKPKTDTSKADMSSKIFETIVQIPTRTNEATQQMAAPTKVEIKQSDASKTAAAPEKKVEAVKTAPSVPSPSTPKTVPAVPTPSNPKTIPAVPSKPAIADVKTDKMASAPIPRRVFMRTTPMNKEKTETVSPPPSEHKTAAVVQEKTVENILSMKNAPVKSSPSTNVPKVEVKTGVTPTAEAKTVATPKVEVKSGVTPKVDAKYTTPNVETKAKATPVDDPETKSFMDVISQKMRDYAEPVMTKLMKDRLNEKPEVTKSTPPEKPKLSLDTNIAPPADQEKLHKLDINAVQSKCAPNPKVETKALTSESKKDLAKMDSSTNTLNKPSGAKPGTPPITKVEVIIEALRSNSKVNETSNPKLKTNYASQSSREEKENPKK